MVNASIQMIPARQLMSPLRFDLMAKYKYVEFREKGYDMHFARALYLRHIEAFSGGSFREPGSDTKTSAEAYLSEFDALIDSIRTNGYEASSSPIPMNERRVIGDGAHRVAACAYFGLDVPVVTEEFDGCYNYRFFQDMYLSEADADYIATAYLEDSGKDAHVLCLWPSAFKYPDKLEQARTLIDRDRLVYKKTVPLTYNGMKNFMIQTYADFEWAGTPEDHFKGIYGKLDPCYAEGFPVEAYLLQCSDEEIVELKSKIRDVIGISNHSCHSSDSRSDALLMAHLLFNENSVRMLNGMDVSSCSELLSNVLRFRDAVRNSGADPYSVIIDSSSVMGVYGIRKTEDLDYISLDNRQIAGFDNHEDYLSYYGISRTDLLFDPAYFGYLFDVKMISLDLLKQMKTSRGEKKDQEDVLLINNYLSSKRDIRMVLRGAGIQLKRNLRNVKTEIRDYLEDHNITFFTKLWHLLRGKGFKA